ncbi:MAG: CHAT domain-containing protein [Magnetococcales bacterium]|nr:CHAT domain-containing protein [Magnetococcales bacterium]
MATKTLIAALLGLFLLPAAATAQEGAGQIPRPIPLAGHSALDFAPSLSANGRLVAFCSERSGNRDIWLLERGEAARPIPRQVTDHPGEDHSPALSSKGDRLLFVSHRTDTRGDIYLQDLLTGKVERLSDGASADSRPFWDGEGRFAYYLKRLPGESTGRLMKRLPGENREEEVLAGLSDYAPGPGGQVVRPGRRGLEVVSPADGVVREVTDGGFLETNPVVDEAGRIVFARYSEDSNQDGVVNSADHSAIWMALFDWSAGRTTGLYQITPEGGFHLQPTAAQGVVVYADLGAGDVKELSIAGLPAFYAREQEARELAENLFDEGRSDEGLMVLGNRVRQISQQAASGLTFDLAWRLREAGRFHQAENVLRSLQGFSPRDAALGEMGRLVLPLYRQAGTLDSRTLRQRVEETSRKVLERAGREKGDAVVAGTAWIESGHLFLLAGDTLRALEHLSRATASADAEVRGRALFSKAKVFRTLNNDGELRKLFLEVIATFGEESRMGRRAIAQALEVAAVGASVMDQTAALRAFADTRPDLPQLGSEAQFRVAELYHAAGDGPKAVEALDDLLQRFAERKPAIRERAWRLKADWLTELERYEEAAAAYTRLMEVGANPREARELLHRLVVQQVRAALQIRDLGDGQVALRRLRQILDRHPEMVEVHRGYIETRAMLGEMTGIRDLYRTRMGENPGNPLYQYGYALALSYEANPDFSRLIQLLEEVVARDGGVASYFQTLGWAYEQAEQVGKAGQGLLEKAASSYGNALQLTDTALFPESEAALLLNLGNVMHALDNHGEAFRHYARREALGRFTRNVTTELIFHKRFGQSAFRIGQMEEAVRQFDKALSMVPEKEEPLRTEIIERLALVYQEMGRHTEAVARFSEALEANVKAGRTRNLAMLRRNIGVNLYRLAQSGKGGDRKALESALESYFLGLDALRQFGVKEQKAGDSLIQMDLALSGGGGGAARGFDQNGEEKLLFGYLADSFARLGESQTAREWFSRQLQRFPSGLAPGPGASVSLLAEKAVVLNRLAGLAYVQGEKEVALGHLRESLGITRALSLSHGSRVNLFNLAVILGEFVVAGRDVSLPLVGEMVAAWRELAPGGTEPLDFHLMTSLAFLFATLEEPLAVAGEEPRRGAERLFVWQERVALGHDLYRRAQELLEKESPFDAGETAGLLWRVLLNRLELAAWAGKEEGEGQLRKQAGGLLESWLMAEGWMARWQEAQAQSDPEVRLQKLLQAGESQLSLSPLLFSRGGEAGLDLLARRFQRELVRTLWEAGRGAEAFHWLERLEARRLAALLYARHGEPLFFAGLGEAGRTLKDRLAAMREAIAQPVPAALRSRMGEEWGQEVLSLFEEHPEAVALLWSYPLDQGVLGNSLSAEAPYLRTFSLGETTLLFLHDGQRILVSSLGGDGQPVEAALREALSAAKHLSWAGASAARSDRPSVRVGTVYDVVAANALRRVFFNRVVVAGVGVDLAGRLPGGEKSESAKDREQSLKRVKEGHVLVFNQAPGVQGLVLGASPRGVHWQASFAELAGGRGHTVFWRGSAQAGEEEEAVASSGWLRSGFPHLVRVDGAVSEEKLLALVSHYQQGLERGRSHEALTTAAAAVGIAPESLRLWGGMGLDPEGRSEEVRRLFQEEVLAAGAAAREEKWPEAVLHGENALAVLDRTGQEELRSRLTRFVVDGCFRTEAFDRAVGHQQQLLAWLEKRQAPVADLSQAHFTLGVLYSRVEAFQSAVDHLQRALTLWEGSNARERLAEGLSTLGVVRENMGDYASALEEFARSSSLYGELGSQNDLAQQYRKIGRIHYLRLGQYERAREAFLEALQYFRRTGDRKGEVESLYDVGLTWEKSGNLEEADRHFQEGRTLATALEDAFLVASGTLYLANSAWYRGDYQDAFRLLLETREEARKAGDKPLEIMVENTRGLVYWTLNQLDKALWHLEEAVKMSKEADIPSELASSYNNLGQIYRSRGDCQQALTWFGRAEEIDIRLKSRWGQSYDARNIGSCLQMLGRLPQARERLLQARTLSSELGDAVNLSKTLLELGLLHRKLGQSAEADAYFNEAFELASRHLLKEVLWRAAAGRAAILAEAGQAEEAIRWYDRAVQMVEWMRAALRIDELRNSFQENKQDLYRELVSLLVQQGREREAFDYVERFRARNFIDLLGNQRIALRDSGDEKEVARVSRLFQELEGVSREVASHAGKVPPALQERLRQMTLKAEEAQLELRQRNPELSSFVSVNPMGLAGFEAKVEPGVAYLAYLIGEKELFIWLVEPGRTRFFKVAVGAGELGETIRQYRERMQRLEPVDPILERLYGWLVAPVGEALASVRYLGIIPDGPLHFLSFSALRGPKGYLVDERPLFYAPSASAAIFSQGKRKAVKNTRVLAMGNPDLGNFNLNLPLAELEANSIRWPFPDGDFLVGAKASKEWFTRNVSRYGIIHIAAHGEFQGVNPLFSALFLSGREDDQQRLTMKEIFSLEINADLVTLSACQTGLGQQHGGEIIGMNRAFLYAGTHALISSLWRVDDLATAVLMKHFYREYAKRNKAESLRAAQVTVKRQFSHPAYWAGFQLQGDYQ